MYSNDEIEIKQRDDGMVVLRHVSSGCEAVVKEHSLTMAVIALIGAYSRGARDELDATLSQLSA